MDKKIVALALAAALLITSDSRPPRPPPIPPPPSPPEGTCETSPSFNAVTWNVALAPGMNRLSTPRAAPVADALRDLDADVVCIEEAWLAADKARIVAALASRLPHAFFTDTSGTGEDPADACDTDDLGSLAECAREKCSNAGEDSTLCAMAECGSDLLGLYLRHKQCLNCLAAGVGKPFDAIMAACTDGKHASRVYGGQNGLVLLSRFPLHDREMLMLPASGANRPVLVATMDMPGRPPVEVACTHLSSPQRVPPMHSGYETWEDEQEAQIAIASARLASRSSGRPVVFLGDMNFGQEHGRDVVAMSRDVWLFANRLGFESPAAFVEPPMCSVCAGNNLRDTQMNQFIDHVLLRNPAEGPRIVACETDRLFDRPVTVTDGAGNPVSTYLSDHYGIRVRLSYR